MTMYRVSWRGVARRTFAEVERPADCLYALWSRHREELTPGLITIDAGGACTFPLELEALIEAGDMHEAAAVLVERHHDIDVHGGDMVVEEVQP
jgi:hypothetical protein